MLHTVLNKVGFLTAEVVSTSTLQVYHVYGEDLTDVPDWDFGMVVVSRSQRKEMGRFMVLSQSPAGKEKESHMTSYPTCHIGQSFSMQHKVWS